MNRFKTDGAIYRSMQLSEKEITIDKKQISNPPDRPPG